ncbi:hypothetical protein OSTOST_23971 [Ostertagia ostertagi]
MFLIPKDYGNIQDLLTPEHPTFCNKKECSDNAPLFCTDTSSSHAHGDNKPKNNYAASCTMTRSETDSSIPRSSVSTRGAQITSTVPMDALEACIANYCLFITNSTNSPAMFPTALIAFDYEVHISAWSKGKLIHRQQLFCQAQAICEMIQCTVCWESIYNLHCWTKIQLSTSCFACADLLSDDFAPVRPRQKQRPSGFRQYTGYRRKLLIAIIIFGLQSSTPCSDFISFTASEEMCVSSETNQTCTYNQATIMTLQPLDQETCLINRQQRQNQ